MGKTAFLFAGQGAQTVGMGKELCEKYKIADDTFNEATEALGMDMKHLVWETDDETLKITENTQPSVVTMSVAVLRILTEAGISADVLAGLSLGEYTAHVAAGSISFADAVRLVKKRGKYMQEEVPVGVATMAAVLGLSDEDVAHCCNEAKDAGFVAPANFNCPGQVVISGEIAAVAKAGEICQAKGAKRVMPLSVSAPFHCGLLKGAGEKLKQELETVTFGSMNLPVITNVTADYIHSEADINDLLVQQVSNPVLWGKTIEKMIEDGVTTFVEIGPGKALSGFVKKISKDVTVLNVENIASLEETLAHFAKE